MDTTDKEMMPLSHQILKNTKKSTKHTKKVNTSMLKTQSFMGL